jgi:hypothetical protein
MKYLCIQRIVFMQDTHERKRKRHEIVNKITEGLHAPPKVCTNIETIAGYLIFKVPSKSIPDKNYTVKMTTTATNKIELVCSCRNQYPPQFQNFYCYHINAAIISLFDKSVSTMHELSLNNSTVEDISIITKKFESLLSTPAK